MTKVFQFCSNTAVDWKQLRTACFWHQSNCLPLPVLACTPCHSHCSLAVTCRSLARHWHSRRRCYSRRARDVATICHRRCYTRLASACSPLLPLARHRRCRLAIAAIAATQACSPSAPRCRQAHSPWHGSPASHLSRSLTLPVPHIVQMAALHWSLGKDGLGKEEGVLGKDKGSLGKESRVCFPIVQVLSSPQASHCPVAWAAWHFH